MSADMACAALRLKEVCAEERLLLLLMGDNTDGYDLCELSVERLGHAWGLPQGIVVRIVRSFAETGILGVEETDRRGWIRVQTHLTRADDLTPVMATERRLAP